MLTNYDIYINEKLKDPEFKAACDDIQPDFDIVRAIFDAYDLEGFNKELLSEQFHQIVLKLENLLLSISFCQVLRHVVAVPEWLEHLPFISYLQPFGHEVGQDSRLRTWDKRLVVLIYESAFLCLLP